MTEWWPREANAVKGGIYYSWFPRAEGTLGHAGVTGEAIAFVRRRRSKKNARPRAFIVFSMGKEAWGRSNSGTASELNGLNNFSALLAVGTVPSCPASGPGVTWGRVNTGLVCQLGKRGSSECELGIGWFAYERCVCRCYGLNVCVPIKLIHWILTSDVMVLRGGAFGRCLAYESGALTKGSCFWKRVSREIPSPFHHLRTWGHVIRSESGRGSSP